MKSLEGLGLSTVTFGNCVEFVVGPQVFARIHEEVRGHRGWTGICAFDWHDDETSNHLLSELAGARQQGRAAAVVLAGAGAQRRVAGKAVSMGIDTRVHHSVRMPDVFRRETSKRLESGADAAVIPGPKLNQLRLTSVLPGIDALWQNHSKVVLLANSQTNIGTDATVILFGNGVTDQWSVGSQDHRSIYRPRIDSGVVISGPAVPYLAEAFLHAYGQATEVKQGTGFIAPMRIPAAGAMAEVRRIKQEPVTQIRDTTTPLRGGVQAMNSFPRRDGAATQWHLTMKAVTRLAASALTIMAPMANPSDDILKSIRDCSAPNKNFITNMNPLNTVKHRAWVHHQSVLHFRRLMDAGVTIYLTKDPLHDKVWLVDNAVALRISGNLNMRSEIEDNESGAVLYDLDHVDSLRNYCSYLMTPEMSHQLQYDELTRLEVDARDQLGRTTRGFLEDPVRAVIAGVGSLAG